MKRKEVTQVKFLTILSIVALIILGYILFHFTKSDKQSSNEQQPFPDFGHMVSPSVVEKDSIQLFKLSQNYPKSLPKTELPDFFKIDYQKNWKEYLLAVQKYCFEGNTNVEFRPELNKTRDWYHMPWQHYGANGREGFHGLTKEAPVGVIKNSISMNSRAFVGLR